MHVITEETKTEMRPLMAADANEVAFVNAAGYSQLVVTLTRADLIAALGLIDAHRELERHGKVA